MRLISIISLQQGYLERSRDKFFEHKKEFQTIGIVLPTEQRVKSFAFIYLGFCLNCK